MVLVLVIWASIAALWGLQAAETLPHPPPLELVFPVLDLMFPVEGVKAATQALAIRETTTEVSIELPGDVLFDFDKWDIRRDAEPTLRQVTEIIQRYPRAKVAIAGHTDAKVEEIYNLRLSEKRAAAVKTWLIQHGGVEDGVTLYSTPHLRREALELSILWRRKEVSHGTQKVGCENESPHCD